MFVCLLALSILFIRFSFQTGTTVVITIHVPRFWKKDYSTIQQRMKPISFSAANGASALWCLVGRGLFGTMTSWHVITPMQVIIIIGIYSLIVFIIPLICQLALNLIMSSRWPHMSSRWGYVLWGWLLLLF